ncbi:MAG: endolytic transglycosylase MltG [Corynebacterium sp.]|nr:endolytic transglycosylase MltG [Corynebacterium sp.]
MREFRRGFGRALAVWVSAAVLSVGSCAAVAYERTANPADYRGVGNGVEELVEIKSGDTLSSLGAELVERKIVASTKAFNTAAANNPNADSITPGVYKLEGRMSAASAVEALTDLNNRVEQLIVTGGQTMEDITVVGGQVRNGIFSSIANVTGNALTVDDLRTAAGTASLEDLGVPAWAQTAVSARGTDPRRIEGLILPGSYVIHPERGAVQTLHDLIQTSMEQLTEDEQRYATLVEASLVERESLEADFPKVARVILNRLANNMRLELDSTVNYDLSEQEVATTSSDRARVTAWNTYAMNGLPATPIGAPSLEAIQAVAHPADGSWLFFVTVDKSGTTVFTNTFEEHQAAVAQAQANGVLDSQR